MKPRVYVETTVPSFYYEVRDEPEMLARRDWTRQPVLFTQKHYDGGSKSPWTLLEKGLRRLSQLGPGGHYG
jgi:hypothetical protein